MKALRVYKSSAGSGKTFTLVSEFLTLVIRQPHLYRHVLAVTFTNKAANELKVRIIKALEVLKNPQSDAGLRSLLIPLLMQNTGLTEDEITARASKIFHHILHHYSELTVVTIDAFVQRLARTFTRELKLPAAYEVLLDSNEMARKTVDLLLDKVGDDPMVTRVLIDFVLQRMDDETDWRVENQLQSFVKKLFGEEAFRMSKQVDILDEHGFFEARKYIRSELESIKSSTLRITSSIDETLERAGIEVTELAGGKTGLAVFLKRAKQFDLSGALGSKYGKEFPNAGKWALASASAEAKRRILANENVIVEKFSELHALMSDCLTRFSLFTIIDKRIYSLALQQQIDGVFQLISNEESLVHISAFNKKLSDALQNASVPYIYERLGERFQHFLIDEFQDTSLLQWHNFLPLIENGLASGKLSLVVGDAKQAIYRFRSGEVEQFIQLPAIFGKELSESIGQIEPLLSAQYDEKSLDVNYRSLQNIVEFNNDFFSWISDNLDDRYRQVYHNLQQDFRPQHRGGLVQFSLIDEDQQQTDAFEERARQIIEEVLADGYALQDIALLFRANKDAASAAQYLIDSGIPVVSAESILLKYSPKVQLVVQALYFFSQPDNPLFVFNLIFLQLKNLLTDEKEFQQEFAWAVEKIPQCLSDIATIETVLHIEAGTLENSKINALSFYDLCEYLIRAFSLDKQADPYLQFFLEMVHQWQNRQPKGLADFLEYWNDFGKNESVVVPESTNAVRVMTVHKAKGLEFPVVIFPHAPITFSNTLTKKDLWVDLTEEQIPSLQYGLLSMEKLLESTRFRDQYLEEIEKTKLDSLNLLYVALTRAVDRLYILASVKASQKKNFYVDYLTQKQLWVEGQTDYVLGEKKPAKAKSEATIINDLNVEFISSDWDKRIYVASDPAYLWRDGGNEARDFGKLIHEILGHIQDLQAAESVIKKYLSDGVISDSTANQLIKSLEEMSQHALIGAAFAEDASIINETEIITPFGEVLRPDRYAELKNKIILIDYKTGIPRPEHHKQLRKYQAILVDMVSKPSEAYLVYLGEELNVLRCE